MVRVDRGALLDLAHMAVAVEYPVGSSSAPVADAVVVPDMDPAAVGADEHHLWIQLWALRMCISRQFSSIEAALPFGLSSSRSSFIFFFKKSIVVMRAEQFTTDYVCLLSKKEFSSV